MPAARAIPRPAADERPRRRIRTVARIAGIVLLVAALGAGVWLGVRELLLAPQKSAGVAGQKVSDFGFDFVATSRCGITEVQGSRPDGEFCQVDLAVTNASSRSSQFSTIRTVGYIDAARYEAQLLPTYAYQLKPPPFETHGADIQAGQTKNFRLFYDVPPGRSLTSVVVHRGSDISAGGLFAAQTNGTRIDLTRTR